MSTTRLAGVLVALAAPHKADHLAAHPLTLIHPLSLRYESPLPAEDRCLCVDTSQAEAGSPHASPDQNC